MPIKAPRQAGDVILLEKGIGTGLGAVPVD